MKANKQSKIKIKKSGFKRSRFNWAHDVNTTFTWGEIQPTQCKMIQPGSKTTMETQNLIRLAPMVAPTFGRVKYKTFNQFVPMADLFENYDAMMAQEPITRTGGTKVPQEIPSVKLGQLSTWVLNGARATLYWKDPSWSGTDLANGDYITEYRKLSNDLSSLDLPPQAQSFKQLLGQNGAKVFSEINHPDYSTSATPVTRLVLSPAMMKASWDNVWTGQTNGNTVNYTESSAVIVLGQNSFDELIPIDRQYVRGGASPFATIANLDDNANYEVTFDGADYIIEFTVNVNGTTYYLALAFELSDFGKRIRKILQGCGYQIDFKSEEWVSIMPIIAQYKAYFDVFGLQLYQGWETTKCAELLNRINQYFVTKCAWGQNQGSDQEMYCVPRMDAGGTFQKLFVDFMRTEVANEWYTEDPDYIGAHMSELAVSPEVDTTGFISVDSLSNYEPNIDNYTTINNDGISQAQEEGNNPSVLGGRQWQTHSFIDSVTHGEVDAELLKRIYRWTNRNSILGREIAKILRAQGLGDYVNECKSNYIGATDNMITISDVVSLADTQNGDDGKLLGEYGGKGLQYIEDKVLVFENDELGYWVTLATVVPESGYTQGLDTTIKALDKFNLYNADFDAIGMEMTTKDTIVGDRFLVRNANVNTGSTGFGFIPRYSKFKVCRNLTNGDFNRHNMRNKYLPYTLDKQIMVNDYVTKGENYVDGNGNFSKCYQSMERSVDQNNLPIAGNVWRMPTKYPWLGNFNRIFFYSGERDEEFNNANGMLTFNTIVGFSDYNEDNFLSHGIYNVQCYAPMKPIEDSYGLEEDEPDRNGVEFTTKA